MCFQSCRFTVRLTFDFIRNQSGDPNSNLKSSIQPSKNNKRKRDVILNRSTRLKTLLTKFWGETKTTKEKYGRNRVTLEEKEENSIEKEKETPLLRNLRFPLKTMLGYSLTAVLGVLLLLFFLYFLIKFLRLRSIFNRLPGPKTVPILGNAHRFIGG